MKKGFIYLFLGASLIFQIGCTQTSTSNNSNQNEQPAVATNTEPQANTKTEETPLPAFTDAETALAEGKKLLDENKTEKSIEALQQAIKLKPELADAHFTLGIALALLENEQEDMDVPEETVNVTQKNKKGKKEVVKLTPSQKAFDDAAKIYEKITKKESKNDVAFFNLGRSYNKLNKDEEAEKALREAVKLKPDDSEYQTELGAILIKLSEYEDAVKVLKKALALDESNLYIQELLEKAEAGEKRINYGVKPKLPDQPQQQPTGKTKPKVNPRATPPPTLNEPPLPKINSNN